MKTGEADRPVLGIKAHPNRLRYVGLLRTMTPEQRLLKSFELTEFARNLFKSGLAASHPDKSETERRQLYLKWSRRWGSKTS